MISIKINFIYYNKNIPKALTYESFHRTKPQVTKYQFYNYSINHLKSKVSNIKVFQLFQILFISSLCIII